MTEAASSRKARAVGINHVALEVDDVDAALEFYGRIFQLELRGRGEGMAFIDMGDQFIALAEPRAQEPDRHRHFGLVVDDRAAVRAALEALGAEILPGRGLDFRDPWGKGGLQELRRLSPMARRATSQLKMYGQIVQSIPLDEADIECLTDGPRLVTPCIERIDRLIDLLEQIRDRDQRTDSSNS